MFIAGDTLFFAHTEIRRVYKLLILVYTCASELMNFCTQLSSVYCSFSIRKDDYEKINFKKTLNEDAKLYDFIKD